MFVIDSFDNYSTLYDVHICEYWIGSLCEHVRLKSFLYYLSNAISRLTVNIHLLLIEGVSRVRHYAPPLFNHDKSIRKHHVLPLDCPLIRYRQAAMTDSSCYIIHDVHVLISNILGLIRLSVDPRWMLIERLCLALSINCTRSRIARGIIICIIICNFLLQNMLL